MWQDDYPSEATKLRDLMQGHAGMSSSSSSGAASSVRGAPFWKPSFAVQDFEGEPNLAR